MHAGNRRVGLGSADFDPQALPGLERVEVIDYLEALLAVGVVDGAQVDEHGEAELVVQVEADAVQEILGDHRCLVTAKVIRRDDRVAKRILQYVQCVIHSNSC